MNLTPTEAEEALDAIQTTMQKMRRSISSSGAYIFLIIWGAVWMFGFLGSQFLSNHTSGYLWLVLDSLGGILSGIVGVMMNRNIRASSSSASGKHIAIFWMLLFVYCIAAAAVAWPASGKQIVMLIILFVMVGWNTMAILLSFYSIWPGLVLTALTLIGYFLLPEFFYIIMAVLGGGMIAMGIYIRYRW